MMDNKPAAKPANKIAASSSKTNVDGAHLKKRVVGSIMGLPMKTGKPSFSRTTSAYTTNQFRNDQDNSSAAGPNTNFQRKPLLDVYREEVKKAREFMDEMVGPSNANDDDLAGGNSDIKSKRYIQTSS
jgi:hypothetical protein